MWQLMVEQFVKPTIDPATGQPVVDDKGRHIAPQTITLVNGFVERAQMRRERQNQAVSMHVE